MFKDKIDKNRLPEHIAIIMDGNGRWAKEKGKNRIFGHRNGVRSVREVSEAGAELGVNYLTLYAFSSENWNRPKAEVFALMELLVRTIRREIKTLQDNNIKLNAIGTLENLPERCRQELAEAIAQTSSNERMTLTLALSYGSRREIADACRKIAHQVSRGEVLPEEVNEAMIAANLYTADIPDPELLIRTSGEYRISNFLLWQAAYAELYFTSKYWPDFNREDLYEAIVDFQSRERRFGKISEQLTVE